MTASLNNLKQTKNPNTSLQTLLVEIPWSAADYYKAYYLKIQENVSNSTWRECPGVWSGSCSGREPSTWSATTSSTWKAEEVTIGMKKLTEKTSSIPDLSICPTRGRRVVATDRYQADGSLTVSTNLKKTAIVVCLGTASNILQYSNYFEFQLLQIRPDILTWLLGKQQKFASNTEGKGCRKRH